MCDLLFAQYLIESWRWHKQCTEACLWEVGVSVVGDLSSGKLKVICKTVCFSFVVCGFTRSIVEI